MQCPICEKLRSSVLPSGWEFSVAKYRESRHGGCAMCSLVLDAVDAFQPTWAADHLDDGLIMTNRHSAGNLWVNLSVQGRGTHQLFIFQHQEPLEERLSKPFFSSLDIIGDTSSDAAFLQISSWISDCTSNHQQCHTTSPSFTPTRLLDVASLGSGSETCFLFEPTAPCAYVALSYRWGVEIRDVAATTKSRLESYTTSITESSLPATIRDAITLCRGIKVPYLWVDMLCIIQDDDEDWRRESSTMHLVYSNALLTVAAHRPTSCLMGFLGEQEFGQATWQRSFQPTIPMPGVGTPKLMYVRIGRPPRFKEATPLEQRGWTVQESILPTRILHFTGAEMAWECNKRWFCECGHILGEPGINWNGQLFLKTLFEVGDASFISSLWNWSDPTGLPWTSVVAEYSRRQLTKSTDKLVALSGLAQSISPVTEKNAEPNGLHTAYKYLAGVWRDHIPMQLLWYVHDGSSGATKVAPVHTHPLHYRAPTWSWASINGSVNYNQLDLRRDQTSHIRVISCLYSPESILSPYGACAAAQLTIEGLLMPVQLITRDGKENSYIGAHWRSYHTLARASDGQTRKFTCDLPRIPPSGERTKSTVDSDSDYWLDQISDAKDDVAPGRFYCVKIVQYDNKWFNRRTLYFLVLKESINKAGSYERVGIGCQDEYNDRPDDFFATAKMTTLTIV